MNSNFDSFLCPLCLGWGFPQLICFTYLETGIKLLRLDLLERLLQAHQRYLRSNSILTVVLNLEEKMFKP